MLVFAGFCYIFLGFFILGGLSTPGGVEYGWSEITDNDDDPFKGLEFGDGGWGSLGCSWGVVECSWRGSRTFFFFFGINDFLNVKHGY